MKSKYIMNNMKLPSITLIVLLIALACAQETTREVAYRQMVRQDNRRQVEAYNAKKGLTYKLSLHSKFADKTYQEIKALYFSDMSAHIQKKLMMAEKPTSKSLFASFNVNAPNIDVNWAKRGFVPPITDQGACGSCYAHAAVADIQSSYMMRGIRAPLSIQQIVDCSWAFGNYGCLGGWMGNVFDYVLVNGITLSGYYPQRTETYFQGIEGPCMKKKGQFKIRSYSYTSYRAYDCQSLTNIVLRKPVSVGVLANYPFIFYDSGIFTGCDPITDYNMNHALVVVGIRQNSVQNYWICRNSWGVAWGEAGYIRIDRNIDYGTHCQICLAPVYSIV